MKGQQPALGLQTHQCVCRVQSRRVLCQMLHCHTMSACAPCYSCRCCLFTCDVRHTVVPAASTPRPDAPRPISAPSSGAPPLTQSCLQARCFIDLIHGQVGQSDLFSLKCGGCGRALTWKVTDWLAAKLSDGVLEGECAQLATAACMHMDC